MDQELTFWDLVYNIDATKKSRCKVIDPLLAQKLNTIDDLIPAGYYLNVAGLPELMPETKVKINDIIKKIITPEKSIPTYQLRSFTKWLDYSARQAIVDVWINTSKSLDPGWIVDQAILIDGNRQLKVLEKLVSMYGERKSKYRVNNVEAIFKALEKDYVVDGCKLLTKSSPALSACLLSRQDIQEEYVILGLKSLSKLSRQRKPMEVDFFALKSLGPRSRLDAMKQLLGLTQLYGVYLEVLPFKVIPTKEEIEEFLFPCSIKYNDEVSSVMKRYEELVKKPKIKEVNYG